MSCLLLHTYPTARDRHKPHSPVGVELVPAMTALWILAGIIALAVIVTLF
jgi:hypothetical protein